MNFPCPSPGCDRKFDNESVLNEHFKRRHQNQVLSLEPSTHVPEKKPQTILPKLAALRRSISKNKDKQKQIEKEKERKLPSREDISRVSKMQVNGVISASRNTLKLNQTKGLKLKSDLSVSQLNSKTEKIVKPHTAVEDKSQITKQQQAPVIKKRLSLRKDRQPIKKIIETPQILKQTSPLIITATSITSNFTQKPRPLLRPNSKQRKTSEVATQKSQTVSVHQRPSSSQQQSIAISYSSDNSRMQIIKTPMKSFSPSVFTIQILHLNNVGLQSMCLQGLQFLYQLSAEKNNLTHMDFLNYQDNGNLGVVNLNFNKIRILTLPQNIQMLSVSSNRIDDLSLLSQSLHSNSSLKFLDISNNNVQSLSNFTYEILLQGLKLTKLNNSVIKRIDIDAAVEYKTMIDRKPMSKTASSKYYQRFTTQRIMVSTSGFQSFRQQDNQRLNQQLSILSAKTRQVNQGLSIIQKQNFTLRKQISEIQLGDGNIEDLQQTYKLLQIQMQTLQLMNFIKDTQQQQISQMILDMKQKLLQIGCQ